MITSADDATLILKNIENLSFDEYIRDMMLQFGTSPASVEKMWKRPSADDNLDPNLTPNPSDKPLAHLTETIFRKQLHPGENLQKLQSVVLENINSAMMWEYMSEKIILSSSEKEDCRTLSLLEWTRNTLLDSATRTFFGDQLLDIEPELSKHFFYFDDNSWLFTYKIPSYWSKDMYAAKKKVQDALEVYFAIPTEERPDQSWLIKTLESEMRGRGIPTVDIAALLNMIYWVINGNAYKLAFWIMTYLLYNPPLLETVKSEVITAMDGSGSLNDFSDRLEKCPQLNAVFNEVLRLISSSMAIRNVASSMTVGGKTLRAGTKVIIPFRQMHFNKDVWGLDVLEFNPERFQGKDKSRTPNFRPFGGGTTHCPGRFFAKREVLGFIGLALARFDLSLDSEDESSRGGFPGLEDKKPCIGIMGPAEGSDVRVVIRPVGR